MAIKVVKPPKSELEQAAILLSLPRDEFVLMMFAQAALAGHPIQDSEIDELYAASKESVLEMAAERGYITRT